MKEKIKEILKYKHLRNIFWHHQHSTKNSSYIVGDADGSFARIVFTAHVAGFINITDHGKTILHTLLKQENETLYKAKIEGGEGNNTFAEFQKNKEIYITIQNLLENISYKKSNHKLIYLGDLLFDRLSNNVTATSILVKTLSNLGVIFIKGNHDHYETIDHKWTGYGANRNKTQENREEIKKVIDNCFILAYFDKDQNILYTHAAIGKTPDHKLLYCHLELEETDNAETLAKAINEIQQELNFEYLQDFRPGSHEYDNNQCEKYIPKNFLHIHGHQETMHRVAESTKKTLHRKNLNGVICMNARTKTGFLPAFINIT